MLLKATEVGLLEGFQIGNSQSDSMLISHLLFADDTLIFCKADDSNLGYLRCALLLFEATSGLRVNLSKSVLPIGEVPELTSLAAGLIACHLLTFVSLSMQILRPKLCRSLLFKSKVVFFPLRVEI